jgi:hypothetical protein
MKFNNNHNHHDKTKDSLLKHVPNKIRQYWRSMFRSPEKNMSQGSFDIVRCMSWSRGENWRRMHPKSKNKQHKH